MTGTSVLPRSLDPLPDESLAGYLLRLSFRLGVPPGQVAAATGLIPRTGTIPASRMLALDEAATRAFAEATRLEAGEATALTVAGLAGRYPPAGLSYLGRQRQPGGIFIKETWILSRSTRYCPQCLAGDPDSPVQQQLGGAWSRLWRLPVVFACPRHQRLLEHACPACGQHRQIAYCDTPPLEANACAALLTLAADILASTSPRSLGQAVGHLAGQAVPAFRRWARWFLAGEGYSSPALRAAAGPAVGARHVIKEATAGANPSRLHPPPRPDSRYDITHVPAYLPAAWHQQHLAPLAGLAPGQLLRRAAAICLARTCTAASYPQLGELLGIPPGSAKSTIKAVHGRLEAAGRQAEFEAAIGALAGMLDTAAARTDYGSRRQALHGWVISPGEWSQLTAGLPAHSDWGERKRMLASAWVWTRVTGGEHLFAPAVMADPAAPRSQQPGGRDRLTYIDLRWPHLATGTRGHYSELRQRLNDYADQLAADIDSSPASAVRQATATRIT